MQTKNEASSLLVVTLTARESLAQDGTSAIISAGLNLAGGIVQGLIVSIHFYFMSTHPCNLDPSNQPDREGFNAQIVRTNLLNHYVARPIFSIFIPVTHQCLMRHFFRSTLFAKTIKALRWKRCLTIFSSGEHFVQRSRTFCAIFAEDIMKNISAKFFLKKMLTNV